MIPYSAAVALILLWLLGLASGRTFHGLIHCLVVTAVLLLLLRTIREKEHH